MKFQGLIFFITTLLLFGCVSHPVDSLASSSVGTPLENKNEKVLNETTSVEEKALGTHHGLPLICKTQKSHLQFDWTAAAPGSGKLDQNTVHYRFRPATHPAGVHGENLKVGECGFAERALSSNKKEHVKFTFDSLSDEATQTFYKMRTGKVFSVEVRQSKNGMVALPNAEVHVLR